MATGFKRYNQGGRFKKPSSGDLGISALRERDQTIIDSLQLSRNQQAEIDKEQLSSIERAFAKEQQNIQDLQGLENKIYNKQLDNIKVRSERDIEAIKGRADEYQRQAKHWEKLAPKLSQAFTQLATGFDNVTHKLGVADALKRQASLDTMQIWAQNFEEGAKLADTKILEDTEALQKAGATRSKLQAFDSTSIFYTKGNVTVITKDLTDNIDNHIKEGLQQYRETFGVNPTTPEELNKAYKWVQNVLEQSVGIQNYKYHKGVISFREEFNKAAARKTNKWTDARNFQIFNTKYDQHLRTFKAEPTQENMDRLVQYTRLHSVDKEGKPTANTPALAIEKIFTSWASDLSITDEELINRLTFLTPKKGRQKGDAGNGYDLSQIGGRNPDLWESVQKTRTAARKKKVEEHNAAIAHANAMAHADAIDFTLNEWNGDLETINKRITIADNNGHEKASKHYKRYLDSFGIGHSSSKKIKQNINNLINSGNENEAWTMLENSTILSAADKKELKAKLEHILVFESGGGKISDLNDGLVHKMKAILKFKGDDKLALPTINIKMPEVKNVFWTSYREGLDKFSGDHTRAYQYANKAVDTELATYEIIKARNSPNGIPAFASTVNLLVDGKLPERYRTDYTSKVKASMTPAQWTGLLNETEKKVISDHKRDGWIEDIKNDKPLEYWSTVDDIENNLLPDHELKGNHEEIIRQLLINTGDENAIEAAKKIRPDNTAILSTTSKRAGFRRLMQKAHTNKDLVILAAFEGHVDQNGSLPVNPKVQAGALSRDLDDYLDSFTKVHGEPAENTIEWMNDGRVKVTDLEYRKTLIENGRRWGIHLAPDGYFYLEEGY